MQVLPTARNSANIPRQFRDEPDFRDSVVICARAPPAAVGATSSTHTLMCAGRRVARERCSPAAGGCSVGRTATACLRPGCRKDTSKMMGLRTGSTCSFRPRRGGRRGAAPVHAREGKNRRRSPRRPAAGGAGSTGRRTAGPTGTSRCRTAGSGSNWPISPIKTRRPCSRRR